MKFVLCALLAVSLVAPNVHAAGEGAIHILDGSVVTTPGSAPYDSNFGRVQCKPVGGYVDRGCKNLQWQFADGGKKYKLNDYSNAKSPTGVQNPGLKIVFIPSSTCHIHPSYAHAKIRSGKTTIIYIDFRKKDSKRVIPPKYVR